ncbi:hypothetical protein A33Q_3804 [Indibacter alkaliphilus LW1]|jgi:hypothetical protein|uniref:Uncharacterized protein n=1 Tax=Indibacter alkaliphilus (strain CCUG 57479 / KCTC 22604 / LW1) TaxID=1189612 RepID=S2D2W7_INDAL|nr:hypothetical protein [Indibacter alkaliphilus]EOZ93214.1 hypothetical protein A33Q_3804 [Indibacter alkaliphilus LW1]
MKYILPNILLIWSVLVIQIPIESFPQVEKPKKKNQFIEFQNKTIPVEIYDATVEALSYFPELEDVEIDFVYRERISGAVMQAQPYIMSLFVNAKDKRKYKIKVSRNLDFAEGPYPIEDVPYQALVGWIGHELGHVMDYLNRSSVNMMHFGAKYFLFNKQVIEAELTADGYAIGCGMGHQILANKNYILNNENFEDSYKDKIKNLYMSPQQILTLQEVLDKRDAQAN